MKRVWCLDFDGVLVNSLSECMLVSYNAYFNENISSISEIPNNLKTFFLENRYWVRPANEYFIIYKAYENQEIKISKEIFYKYKEIYVNEISSFGRLFFQKRNEIRANNLQAWLELHQLYPQVKEWINLNKENFFIVTTKDRLSVQLLAKYFGFFDNIIDIFSKDDGENKVILFKLLFDRYNININETEVVFVDDNEEHLEDLSQFPIKLYYANWGFTPIQKSKKFQTLDKLM